MRTSLKSAGSLAEQSYVFNNSVPWQNRHLHLALPDYSNIAKAARDLYGENEDRFKVYSQPPEFEGDDWPCFKIEGPAEFLEPARSSGISMRLRSGCVGWPQFKRQKKPAKATIRHSQLVSDLFDDIARDAAIQQVLGLKYDAKYLN